MSATACATLAEPEVPHHASSPIPAPKPVAGFKSEARRCSRSRGDEVTIDTISGSPEVATATLHVPPEPPKSRQSRRMVPGHS
jgi:hypothetical protein